MKIYKFMQNVLVVHNLLSLTDNTLKDNNNIDK